MTSTIFIEKWWCCLNPVEKTAFTLGAVSVGLGQTYIYGATFDAVWIGAIGSSPAERSAAFITTYGLEAGVISCGEDCEIDVYFMDMGYWGEVYAFSLTDAFVCEAPCKVLTFSS